MNILGVLARNEWLKTVKRRAFLVTLGLYTFMATMGFGQDFLRAMRDPERDHSLPSQWPEILGETSQIPVIFGAVVLILLVAAEFNWRTARQNVIDGLSREQWYWGKVVTMLMVVAIFCGWHLVIGSGFALAGTDLSAGADLFTSVQVAALGGMVMSALGYAAFALMVSTITRGTGSAMAVWFFVVTVGEMLLRGGIGRFWEASRPYLQYFPIRSFDESRNYLMFDEALLESVTASRIAEGDSPPHVGDPDVVLLTAAIWVVVFVGIGFLAFRRRDL
jgi:ABC-type transport system involved in multi-copper enzyme maturation permease subunit